MADVAADLVGPNVVFRHSKLNFKWFDESDTVKWHQDIQFFPHTNYNVLTIGCYLMDTDMSNRPLAVKPGSHNRPLFDQFDSDGNWTGTACELVGCTHGCGAHGVCGAAGNASPQSSSHPPEPVVRAALLRIAPAAAPRRARATRRGLFS